MVPHVAARGSSFKGAGLYYLHDKSAMTSERVAWTQTRNLPTNEPKKALKWMAYTAMNADKIKAEHGGSRAGRKSGGKPVYTYSLSWHENDKPTREEMEAAAEETLRELGLENHESIVVAHRDTSHPHVHIICNLVNPNTGRTHTTQLDHKKLSEWAQAHDKRFGRDHCPERIQNNLDRNKGELKKQFVKHQTKEDPRAQMIQDLYNRSDSGKAFRAALHEQGYALAQGHKGRIALVNEEGQVFSLARQLKKEDGKGFRAKDVKAALKDVDLKSLPQVKELVIERQHFDRDKYAYEQEEKAFQAGIDSDDAKRKVEEEERRKKEDRDKRKSGEKAAKSRQNRRHKLAAKYRKPYSIDEKSNVHEEFNQEVKDLETEQSSNVIPRQSFADKIQKAKTKRKRNYVVGEKSDIHKEFGEHASQPHIKQEQIKKGKEKDQEFDFEI